MKSRWIVFLFLFQSCLSCVDRKDHDSLFVFAFLSDTHIGSPGAEEDLSSTVEEINNNPAIDFTVVTGDITEMGSDEELQRAKDLLDKLKKPWYVIPGNHDTKWSASGNASFQRIFGYEKFVFEEKGFLFAGCSSGPNMRMAPGLVPREHLLWLDSLVIATGKSGKPLIFLNHYPLDEGLANWYEVIDLLKKGNIQLALCGHGHFNRAYDFEGIPGVMGRSTLTTKRDSTGYNIVTCTKDSLWFNERLTGVKTKPTWHRLAWNQYDRTRDLNTYDRPGLEVNKLYPTISEVWKVQDSSDVGGGLARAGDLVLYPNSNGYLNALHIENGEPVWYFKTGGKIYATPAVKDSIAIIASTDGSIYSLEAKTGRLRWQHSTTSSIVASPVIDGSSVFCGSSQGVFWSFDLISGKLLWRNDSIRGFVETFPLVDNERIYFGDWSNHFYALNKKDGSKAWEWSPGGNRLLAPAACYPVKANGKIFIVAPDRYTTALDAVTGRVVWRTNLHRGRESMGISEDGSLLYIKDMQDSIHAFYTRPDKMQPAWSLPCGFGYEISPTPIIEKDEIIFVPTQWGTLYAVDKASRKVIWKWKLSHAIISGMLPLEGRSILVSTMDGMVARITY